MINENFLLGYQFADSNGLVVFTTIYPGWYQGRAVHTHMKVRIFDASGNVTITQLFLMMRRRRRCLRRIRRTNRDARRLECGG